MPVINNLPNLLFPLSQPIALTRPVPQYMFFLLGPNCDALWCSLRPFYKAPSSSHLPSRKSSCQPQPVRSPLSSKLTSATLHLNSCLCVFSLIFKYCFVIRLSIMSMQLMSDRYRLFGFRFCLYQQNTNQ